MKIKKTKIVRVTPCGTAPTYNLTMRGPHHNYFANGLLTANSHSVCYAFVAFQTAYLKAHFPAHFYAAVLSNEVDNSDKVLRYSAEARAQGIQMLPPCVNESDPGFTPISDEAIRYGLSAIKGLGQAAVSALIDARGKEPFTSVFELAGRVPSKSLNKRVLESLAAAGACDIFQTSPPLPPHEWRPRLQATTDRILEHGARTQRERDSAQVSIFDMFGGDGAPAPPDPPLSDAKPWTQRELLTAEKAAIGFYLSGHPLEEHAHTLRSLGLTQIDQINNLPAGSKLRIGGLVSEFTQRTTKKGAFYSWFRLEDLSGAGIKCVLWPESHSKFSAMCQNDALIYLAGRTEGTGDGIPSLVIDEVYPLAGAAAKTARAVVITVSDYDLQRNPDLSIARLASILRRNVGSCQVFFDIVLPEQNLTVRLKTAAPHAITPDAKTEDDITALGCGVQWLNSAPNG